MEQRLIRNLPNGQAKPASSNETLQRPKEQMQ